MRLTQKQLREIIEEAIKQDGDKVHDDMTLIGMVLGDVVIQHINTETIVDDVMAALDEQVNADSDLLRPARYEDVNQFADIIVEFADSAMRARLHSVAKQVLHRLMG